MKSVVKLKRRAMREADKGPGMRVNVGDYVMVSVTKNQVNRQHHNKNMVDHMR